MTKFLIRFKSNWRFVGLMKEKLSKKNYKPLQEQIDKVVKVSDQSDKAFVQKCIYSIKIRIKEVIKMNEIKYGINF